MLSIICGGQRGGKRRAIFPHSSFIVLNNNCHANAHQSGLCDTPSISRVDQLFRSAAVYNVALLSWTRNSRL